MFIKLDYKNIGYSQQLYWLFPAPRYIVYPIVSSNSHPTERISEFVDYHLQPFVSKLPSYVKDTNDFLNKLKLINNLPSNTLLVILDMMYLPYILIFLIMTVLMHAITI